MLVIIHLISGTGIKIEDMAPEDVSMLIDAFSHGEDRVLILAMGDGKGSDEEEVGPGVLHVRREHITYIEVR